MGKKFNASANQNTEDLAAKTFADPERFVTNEIPEIPNTKGDSSLDSEERTLDVNEARNVSDADVPSWDSEEHIWSAAKAHKVSDAFETRIFKKGLRDVMRYVKTAANSGQYECTVFNDNVNGDVDIDAVIRSLAARGYTVKKFEQYSGWYIKISW